jgi:hypothetical protein
MVYHNLFGEYRREMQQLQIITSVWELIEWVHNTILTNLQVEMVKDQRINLVISTEVHTLLLLMGQEHHHYQEQMTGF